MAKIYAFMAPGMEEVECLAVVDVLIRGGMRSIWCPSPTALR